MSRTSTKYCIAALAVLLLYATSALSSDGYLSQWDDCSKKVHFNPMIKVVEIPATGKGRKHTSYDHCEDKWILLKPGHHKKISEVVLSEKQEERRMCQSSLPKPRTKRFKITTQSIQRYHSSNRYIFTDYPILLNRFISRMKEYRQNLLSKKAST